MTQAIDLTQPLVTDPVSLEREIDHLATFMALSQKSRGEHVPLTFFNGADPFSKHFVEAWIKDSPNENRYFIQNVKPTDLDESVDYTVLGSLLESNQPDSRNLSLSRVRRVSPIQARGKARPAYPYTVQVTWAVVKPNSDSYIATSDYAGWDGKAWKFTGLSNNFTRKEYVLRAANLAASLQFSARYEWSVRLGYEGHPTIRFATDPVGAMEVFRLRDIPEGKTRRAALRNWVVQHWRKKHAEPVDYVKVRRHLRGAETFRWNGLTCVIQPSAFDLEQLTKERQA
jgi:hypothetical protein